MVDPLLCHSFQILDSNLQSVLLYQFGWPFETAVLEGLANSDLGQLVVGVLAAKGEVDSVVRNALKDFLTHVKKTF